MRTNELVFERTYNAPIAKVWKAITDKNQMKEWYFDIKEFKAEKGFEFSFYGGSDDKKYLHKCTVTEVDPITKLAYSWGYDGYPGNSIVKFELTPESESRTRLKLTHSGLASFPEGDPAFAPESFGEGWTYITGTSLAEFVETDTIRQNLNINATAGRIWQIILNPNNQWAKAFGGGAYAKTDWKEGSEIIWTDQNDEVGARGLIKTRIDDKKLVMEYFDEITPAAGELPGEYQESFELIPGENGTVLLKVSAGPLARKYINSHSEMWVAALRGIQTLAEDK